MGIMQALIGAATAAGFKVKNSVRLRASASACLLRTPIAAGNQKRWTFSTWVKRGTLGVRQDIFTSGTGVLGGGYFTLYFDAADKLNVIDAFPPTPTNQIFWTSAASYRDPQAHYHIVVFADTPNVSPTSRLVVYVNGEIVSWSVFSPQPAQNADTQINRAIPHNIGRFAGNNLGYLDGHASDTYFIDGQTLSTTAFGEFNSSGVWVPKIYTGTYGVNGFHLKYEDASSVAALGLDSSGNANNWTPTNISVTPGVTYDNMVDTPTNNYATLNPLKGSGTGTLNSANLGLTQAAAAHALAVSTVSANAGKFYFEGTMSATPTGSIIPGIGVRLTASGQVASGEFCGSLAGAFGGIAGPSGMTPYSSGVAGTALSTTVVANNVMAVAIDLDAGKFWVGVNNLWAGGGSPSAGTLPTYTFTPNTPLDFSVSAYVVTVNPNFGQRPFTYTPPTGFKALCTDNLPTPAIPKGSDHFSVVLAAGAAIKAAMDALFSGSVFEWIKDRANANNHQLADNVRGLTAILQSNTTAAEGAYVAPAGNSVGWGWKTGGAPVANNAGSIASQVSANTMAGFSVVTYTGNGISGATVGHGLGVVPKMVIIKNRDAAWDWPIYHSGLAASNQVFLNLTLAQAAISAFSNGGVSAVSNTTCTLTQGISTINNVNAGTIKYVAYAFAEVPGFSKFGSYVGNGSAVGPCVYCGFRPRWVMWKRADGISDWVIEDTARSTYNAMNLDLLADLANAEAASGFTVDFLSNGFKIRNATASGNTNGATLIYAAFAEYPFGGSDVAPSPAR